MAKSFAFATVLLLTAFPAVAVGDATPICDAIIPFMPTALGCNCVPSASGTGGIATCTQTIPDPAVSFPAMSLSGIEISPAVVLPQVSVQVGTEVKPCANPARAAINARISIPADVPNEIVVMIDQLVDANTDAGWSLTTTDAGELRLAIEQSAEAGENLDIDIPFFVVGAPGAQFYTTVRLTMRVSMNAGSLSVTTSVDTCLRQNFNVLGIKADQEFCGSTLPSCTPEAPCVETFDPLAFTRWPGPWCCSTNQMNLLQAFGDPPVEVFKMTFDFTDICNTAGPDPVDPNPAPNPNKPAAQESTADEGMDGGAIAGLVIGLLILFGIIVYAFVNRDKLPCVNTKTQLNEVTELAIENK